MNLIKFPKKEDAKPKFSFPTKDVKYWHHWNKDSKPEYNFREGWKLFEDDWQFVEFAKINLATLAMGASIASDIAKDYEAAQEFQEIIQDMLAKKACMITASYIPKYLLGFMFYFGGRNVESGIPEVDRVFHFSSHSSMLPLYFSHGSSDNPEHPLNTVIEGRIPLYARPFLTE